MTGSTNAAFEEGYDAYWDGVDVSDNPHGQASLLGRGLEVRTKTGSRGEFADEVWGKYQ